MARELYTAEAVLSGGFERAVALDVTLTANGEPVG